MSIASEQEFYVDFWTYRGCGCIQCLSKSGLPNWSISGRRTPPTMEEMVQELRSPIGIMDEELLPPFGVVAEEKMQHVATPNLNDITRTTKQKLDPLVETCKADQV